MSSMGRKRRRAAGQSPWVIGVVATLLVAVLAVVGPSGPAAAADTPPPGVPSGSVLIPHTSATSVVTAMVDHGSGAKLECQVRVVLVVPAATIGFNAHPTYQNFYVQADNQNYGWNTYAYTFGGPYDIASGDWAQGGHIYYGPNDGRWYVNTDPNTLYYGRGQNGPSDTTCSAADLATQKAALEARAVNFKVWAPVQNRLIPTCRVASQTGPGGSEIDFEGEVDTNLPSYQQQWTFSDGTTSSASVVHKTATMPGDFTGTFRAWVPSTSYDKSVTCTAHVTPPEPFRYEMPARFGLDDDEDGRIDYPSTMDEVTPPEGFDVDLIVYRSQCDDATFSFVVKGEGAASDRVLETARDGCTFSTKLDEGTYDIALLVDGEDDGSAEVKVDDLLIVSMGDSLSSGEGNPESDGNLWRENKEQCHRSAGAGPAKAALKAEEASKTTSVTFVHLACSGATIPDGLLGTQPFTLDPSGFDQFAEFDRLVDRDVDALMLSVGANDVGFGPILRFCATEGDDETGCDDEYYENVTVGEALPNQLTPGNQNLKPILTSICDATTAGDTTLHVGIPYALGSRSAAEQLLVMRDGRDWKAYLNPGAWDYDGVDDTETFDVNGPPIAGGTCESLSTRSVAVPLDSAIGHDFPRVLDGIPARRPGGLLGSPQIQPSVPAVAIVPPTLDDWVERRLEELPDRFADLATRVNARVDPDKVFLTEYVNPLTDERGETCENMLAPPFGTGIDEDEANWAWHHVLNPLNGALRTASGAAQWKFVGGLSSAFRGHGYCATADRWVEDLAESTTGQGDPFGAMHPNELGHEVIGTKLFDALDKKFDLTPGPAAPRSGESTSTNLSESAQPGDHEIQIDTSDGFEKGDVVVIAPGTDREEHGVIEDFGSIILEDPIGYPHDAGTRVVSIGPAAAKGAVYVPVSPCRVVDTRVAGGALANREIREYQVGGAGGVFAAQGGLAGGCGIPEGAQAVEASVTAVSPSTGGFFRAYPADESMPNATFMNMARGQDITNTGSVALASTGTKDLKVRNFGGATQYVIDVQGYFIDPEVHEGAVYVPVSPCRVVDTRVAGGALANREIREYQVGGAGGVFAAQGGLAGGCGIPEGAQAVEASVTAVSPSTGGFFRAYPADESMPNATFMNMARGQDITNTGSVALASTGTKDLKVRNFGGATQYVIDVQGYFIDPEVHEGAVYVPVSPCRVVDTRVAGGALANREIREYQVGGAGGVFAAQGGLAGGCGIPEGAQAVEASVTAVSPSTGGFFRAYPADESMPNATFMNMARGQDITNTGSVALASTGTKDLKVRNFGGATQYVIDVQGYFTPPLRPDS